MTTTVAVSGASGRLGTFVCETIDAHPAFKVAARLTSASGADDGAGAEILFDVSRPQASPDIVARALRKGQRVIVGTSGWSADRLATLQQLIDEIPGSAVLVVPNFSLGSVLGTMLARIAAPHFASAEIVESHHAGKVDSPSGTAVRTAESIAEAVGEAVAGTVAGAGAGRALEAPFADQPARGQLVAGVPVHSLRMQGVVASQQVRFGGEGEELVIDHITHSQAAYRAGIRAALEAVGDEQFSGLAVGLESVLKL